MSRPFFLGNPHSPWTELPPGLRETITALTGICRRPEAGRRAGSPPWRPGGTAILASVWPGASQTAKASPSPDVSFHPQS